MLTGAVKIEFQTTASLEAASKQQTDTEDYRLRIPTLLVKLSRAPTSSSFLWAGTPWTVITDAIRFVGSGPLLVCERRIGKPRDSPLKDQERTSHFPAGCACHWQSFRVRDEGKEIRVVNGKWDFHTTNGVKSVPSIVYPLSSLFALSNDDQYLLYPPPLLAIIHSLILSFLRLNPFLSPSS